jgi:pyruvate dehydrogenase E2 component (dihydrolipoamide acetyltransferase)
MAFNFVLPDLGEGIAEGEIRKWLVKEGSIVEEHQAILEIETDKAVVEVPSPKGGTVLKINKEEGSSVKVGEVLIVIGEIGEKIGEQPPIKEKPKGERPKSVSVVGELPEEEEELKPAAAWPKLASVTGRRSDHEETTILAVPSVRVFAKEQGISLDKIKGSGPGGSISREDVLKAAKLSLKAEDQYGPFERVAIKGLRKTIAKNLILAQKTMAFVTETDEADITDLWDLRAREKKALEDKGVHLTFVPFFMKAIQHTLMEFGTFNASVDEEREEILLKKYFNIGVAVDTAEGLIVIKNVEKKTIRELAEELQSLSKQARDRTVKLEDLRGSSFTITNYGTYGSIYATPIVNYPDVAILGTGKITDKPWVKGGQIKVRKILPLSLTFDHRVNDGAGAAKFLTRLLRYLEDPASIFIESA